MKTILLIEDNTEIRENMGEILELANYKVLLAADGKAGITTALAEKPDLIVCDIMMPELDGYGVIHLLQKHEDMQHIPFIFITAMAERTEMRKGMELGADDYITKPFTGTELLKAIEGRLSKAKGKAAGASTSLPTNFSSVNEAFKAEGDVQHYQKKQTIYSEGHPAFRLYKVVSGKVKIFKTNDDGKDLIITVCSAGDYFGYNALLEGTAAKEGAEALEPSEVASISNTGFRTVMENPAIVKDFIQLLAGNVREAEAQLLAFAYNSLRKKVAGALVMLHHKCRVAGSEKTIINLSRENIAGIAGTAKESLIRTLGDFRDEGLISLIGRDIIVLEEKKLQHLLN